MKVKVDIRPAMPKISPMDKRIKELEKAMKLGGFR